MDVYLASIEACLSPPKQRVGHRVDAAVSVVLVERETLHLLFIRKREEPGYPWSGQVAFPGGRVEATDATSRDTALRELEEELGLPPTSVEVLGSLGLFETLSGALTVEAFVLLWTGEPTPRPLEHEIDWLAEVPLAACMAHHAGAGFAGTGWQDIGVPLTYPVRDRTAWGLSARILHTLIEGLS